MPRSDSYKKVRPLFGQIRAACEADADPARAAKYARFFTEGYDPWGINLGSPAWRAQQKAWLDDNRKLGIDGFLRLGDLLVTTGRYEEAMLAILFLKEFREKFTPATFAHIAKWFDGGFRNWAHTDVLCGEVLGDFLVRGVVALDAPAGWRDSPHKYQRRTVPVMMLPLLDTTKDYRPLLDLLRPMMHDGEKVVRQGLGWFLREAWKRQPRVVEPFLMEYKDTAPRLIFQYATEKMSAAQKERFRASKTKKAR